MNSLRRAYNNKKIRNSKIISEAAIKWLAKNVILINERIDRVTVTRLIDSIQKFENTFGDYKDKLPTIANYLNSAENGLRMVITGQSTDRKTSNMLEQLTYLYSLFSDFFTRDLPVLLRTKLFEAAKEHPDTKLSQLYIQTSGKFDTNTVRAALAQAIKPSRDEQRLLSRIYRSTALPKINAEAIANELLQLSYNDLVRLTEIGKVPMAVADYDDSKADMTEGVGRGNTQASEQNLQECSGLYESVVKHVPQGSGTFTTPEIATEILRKAIQINERNEALVLEARVLLEANLEEIKPAIDGIKRLVNSVEMLKPLSGPVSELQSKVLDVLADGDIKSYLLQAAQEKNPTRFLANLFTTPKGKILAQANLAIETIKSVVNSWQKIKPILDKNQISKKDIANVKRILTKDITGGGLKKLTSMFKTRPFPGLAPEDILNVILQPLDTYLQTANFFEARNDGLVVPLKEQENDNTAEKIGGTAAQALETFKQGMEQISSVLRGGTVSSPTKATVQPVKSAEGQTDISDEVVDTNTKAISDALGNKLNPKYAAQLAAELAKRGYAITKK